MSYINLGQVMWPVGSVYMSFRNQDPGEIFGGGWVHITGKFLYANDNTSTGGNNTHTLSEAELPVHNHKTGQGNWFAYVGQAGGAGNNTYFDGGVPNGTWCLRSNNGVTDWSLSGKNTGGGKAHNNMPAYQSVYCWQRLS